MELKTQLEAAKKFLLQKIPNLNASLAITLGSGLSHFADALENKTIIPFADIPHFAPPTVVGHGGNFIFGSIDKFPLIVLQGRIHHYEGHDWEKVVFPTRLVAYLKTKMLLLTNASGGLNPKMKAGSFMVITDQINLTGGNPLRGPNHDFLGTRFPDMSNLYDKNLAQALLQSLKKVKAPTTKGIYCGVSGPSYETAAEIKFLRKIGGSAVGMSTVAEAIAARHAGLKIAGLSCITNLGTGLSKTPLSHKEVTEAAKHAEVKFTKALISFVAHKTVSSL